MCLDPKHKLCGYKGLDCSGDPVLVKQEFVKESDVNVIVANCLRRGTVLPGAEVQAAFADVTLVGDFRACQDRIVAAQSAFMELPAELRARFHNDTAELLDFVNDRKNYDEAVKLGLVAKKLEPEAPGVPPAVPAVPAAVVPPVVPPKAA